MDYPGRAHVQVDVLPVKLSDGISTAKAARKWLRKVRRPAAAAAASPTGISTTPTTMKAAAKWLGRTRAAAASPTGISKSMTPTTATKSTTKAADKWLEKTRSSASSSAFATTEGADDARPDSLDSPDTVTAFHRHSLYGRKNAGMRSRGVTDGGR